MAEWHLKELRNTLEKKGWRIVKELPGDGYAVSATWEIHRNDKAQPVFIDFNGLDDMVTLPIERSYGCHARSREWFSLDFARRGQKASNRRQSWQSDLKKFVERLDAI